MVQMTISMVSNGDVPVLARLEEQARDEGYSFVDRAIEEWASGANRFDRPGEGIFLAKFDAAVVGMCGLNRDPYLTDPSVGRLRHLYVSPDVRRKGVGRSLVRACIDLAGRHFDRVRLRTLDPGAAAFYEMMGFKPVDEPDATHSIDL